MTMISVMNVSKQFGERFAVEDLSLSVDKGEILGFLGPNGAGKTTTMRMITGFLPPTKGSITVDNLDVFEHPHEVKKRIGYMPEHPPLYYDMTVEECLSFVAEIHGLKGSRVRQSIDHVAALCGITHMLKRLTGNLSKGYRQRAGLAQALIHDPPILVLDEPTSGLDPAQIIEIRELIRRLGKERTVILSSHILPEVTNSCKRVAIINNGRLVAIDTIEGLSSRLSSGRQVLLKVVQPSLLDTSILRGIDGVTDVTRHADTEYIINVKGKEDVLSSISSAVVKMGAGLVELTGKSMTLEDIFIRVLSGDGKE